MSSEADLEKTVLFIDDEVINLLGLKARFRRMYHVYTAVSAEEGLRLLEDTRVDAIVSDQRMPGMTGTQFFSTFHDHGLGVVRIILTAYPEEPEIKEAIGKGLVDAVFDKPLRSEELIACIEGTAS